MLSSFPNTVQNVLGDQSLPLDNKCLTRCAYLDAKGILIHPITSVAERKELKVRDGLESIPGVLVVDNELECQLLGLVLDEDDSCRPILTLYSAATRAILDFHSGQGRV